MPRISLQPHQQCRDGSNAHGRWLQPQPDVIEAFPCRRPRFSSSTRLTLRAGLKKSRYVQRALSQRPATSFCPRHLRDNARGPVVGSWPLLPKRVLRNRLPLGSGVPNPRHQGRPLRRGVAWGPRDPCTREARRLGLTHVDLRHGSCLARVCSSMRFSRIYVGAGADEATADLALWHARSWWCPRRPLL